MRWGRQFGSRGPSGTRVVVGVEERSCSRCLLLSYAIFSTESIFVGAYQVTQRNLWLILNFGWYYVFSDRGLILKWALVQSSMSQVVCHREPQGRSEMKMKWDIPFRSHHNDSLENKLRLLYYLPTIKDKLSICIWYSIIRTGWWWYRTKTTLLVTF